MVVEFTAGNFLSFHQKKTLSFEAKSISELKENLFIFNKHKLLRSAVIYGANSNGKSNVIKALWRMKNLIISSVKLNDTDELDFSPFLLAKQSENTPTFFEIVFLAQSKKYRYGFEYNQKEIVNEWLFEGENSKTQKPLFIRTQDGIGVTDKFEEGKGKESATNNNRLFISLVAQLGGNIAKKILELFNGYNVLSGVDHEDYKGFSTLMMYKKLAGCDESLSLFKKLKLGFEDLSASEIEFSPLQLPEGMSKNTKSRLIKELTGKKQLVLMATHNKFDKKGKIIDTVSWDRADNESDGTNKIIDLSGPIFDTLNSGHLLVIDELDAKLHPLITINIVNLFNNPVTNPNNARLLFTTHDTNLLSGEIFRRDQIWFTEKDNFGQTDLYSLYSVSLPDGTRVRSDESYEKNYIRGRYGAIPFITN
ncbi:MAG: ATP-binding protein [Ferruginibacter sp.]|nr:ATP-binding protein [Ferruginibacter sp.]